MAGDPLDQVLRLVVEGRITAAEAAAILGALEDRPAGVGSAGAAADGAPGSGRQAGAGTGPTGSAGDDGRAGPGLQGGPAPDLPATSATSLRLEVREGGRQVVNLRLPIAVGRLALDRVPGLSAEQVERVREALNFGMKGPILQVQDGDNGVLIVLE